jgi:hypothetical protein
MLTVENHFAIDENQHMLPYSPELIEHITSRALILLKVVVEHRA